MEKKKKTVLGMEDTKLTKDMNDMVLSSRTSSSSKKRHKSKHVIKAKAKNKKRVIGGGNQGGPLGRKGMELILKGKARTFPPWAAGSTSKEVSRVSPSPPGSPQTICHVCCFHQESHPQILTSCQDHHLPSKTRTHKHPPRRRWPPKCSVT